MSKVQIDIGVARSVLGICERAVAGEENMGFRTHSMHVLEEAIQAADIAEGQAPHNSNPDGCLDAAIWNMNRHIDELAGDFNGDIEDLEEIIEHHIEHQKEDTAELKNRMTTLEDMILTLGAKIEKLESKYRVYGGRPFDLRAMNVVK